MGQNSALLRQREGGRVMKRLAFKSPRLLLATICLASCATTKEFTATNGSRADGTVTLSYEYGLFESPQENQEQGITLASSTCAGWGYSGSQPFGETRQCNAVNGYGSCVHWTVTRRYQCIGSPHDVAPAAQTMATAPQAAATAAPQLPAQAATAASQIPAQAAASVAPPIATEQPNLKSGDDWERQ
jgi:YecR-like lipoprotein